MIFYLCFLIIMCGADARHSVKGLYCQDPDTYKLYPVNATWPSETFCGNYTCKLRKRNNTETEYMPITKINITDKHLVGVINDMATSPSEQVYSVINNLNPDKRPVFYKENIIETNDVNQNNNKNDRYLTEAEIKAITDVLHTVKKSDLEAIIEIYNLAQDIYKEMDGEKTENLVKETVNIMKEDLSHVKKTESTKSYFYKPLHQTQMEKNLTDMNNESSRTTPYLRRPLPSIPFPLTYFNGPITSKDFGRTPYYYPMSNFQRSASYVYNNNPYLLPTTPPIRPYTKPPVRPCAQPRVNFFPSPWYDRSIIKPYVKQQRPASPMLLPYPFSHIHHYNYSSYPASYYYNHYPWAQLDSYKKKEYSPFKGYSNQKPAEDKQVETSKEKSSEETKDDVESEAESTLPEWKTKPLSEKIIDEVRANILDKSSLLKPFRKNVKLERVGKVIKLDELTRDKRSIIEVKNMPEDVYEAYIETTKCEPSTDPGFFRVGNLSAVYPECCPQRIS